MGDSLPIPPIATTPNPSAVPAPVIVAEPGGTTTEFKFQLVNLGQAILTTAIGFGAPISVEQKFNILTLESFAVAAGFSIYTLSRGIRKQGTGK